MKPADSSAGSDPQPPRGGPSPHITVDSLNVDRDNPTSESFMPNAHNFSVQNLTVAETYVQNNYHSAQGDFTRATEPVSELAPAKRVNLEFNIQPDKYRHENVAVEPAIRLYEQLKIHPSCPRAIYYPDPGSKPSSPDHYLRNGILPGHVGYFTREGCFQYLFNITSLEQYPPSVSCARPEWLLEERSLRDSEPLADRVTCINTPDCVVGSPGLEYSVSETSTGEVVISMKSSEGVLVPHGAAIMLPEETHLLAMKQRSLINWVKKRGMFCVTELAKSNPSTINRRLLVVGSVLKTSSWGIISFLGAAGQVEFKLRHNREGITRQQVISHVEGGACPASFYRAKQYDRSLCNQGVAIAGTALYLSPESQEKLRQLVAAERGEPSYNSEPQHPVSRRDESSPSAPQVALLSPASDFKGKSKASPTAEDDLVQDERVRKDSVPAPDPSEAISDWLFLQKPKAELSVVHDKDWLAVLNPDDLTIPRPEDLLKRVQAVYEPEYTDSTKKIVALRRKKVFKPLVDPLLLEFAQMSLW